MSFITKRERVFNEYDLFDLPARNEGKLKAYSSCTDARAWSHFCSDKTEHLVEIIKRNNETVRPKYIPTDVIVNTLMSSKNAEIARLRRKIEEFEQMMAAYDELDLTCDQKCDIANAHAAIKAANKELDEMFLDLDLSGFTEGIDSEAFETGKSRGDEPSRYTGETGKSRGDEWTMGKVSTPRMQTKSNQIGTTCKCDASTSAHDKRIDELQETIINKDAKLSAMQNTIAVMENDVCEPYCIYAHIYTALEKIFATLCQNEKYKQYLDLLTAGKDTRGIDVKGKILFKMKVLEKFSLALIAPCSQNSSSEHRDCSCYRAEIVTHVETTFALTSAESKIPSLDNKRAQLVADIMQNEDMKEILSKESLCIKLEDDELNDSYTIENYSIDSQNLKRLKKLQSNYDELLNCYDNLKHERDTLNIRCQKYIELENESECLQNKLREYNQLWKEKEYYRKRSEDLDSLKEKYYILSEETANIETKLKAEQEINKIKSATVDELRTENIKLENKISEISLSFEQQRNVMICKLKECECKMMCQEQQIASLTNQVESLLRGDNNKILQNEDESRSIELIDEIESQKEQIKNLKDALCCKEEEKQYFQEEFEKNLEIINGLKLETEDWKRKYEETNDYLGNYLEKYQTEINELQDNNNTAIENLNHIIYSKSQEISYLIDEVERKNVENDNLAKQVKSIHDGFENRISLLENEKKMILSSIHSARKDSLQILENVKKHNNRHGNESNESLGIKSQENIRSTEKEIDLNIQTDNMNCLKEIQLLREINQENVHLLQNENEQLKRSFEVTNKEMEKLKKELLKQEDFMEKFKKLTESHENLLNVKERLQIDLNNKTYELDNIIHAYQLTKKESESLMDQLQKSESIQDQYIKLTDAYQKIIADKNVLQNKLLHVEKENEELHQSQEKIIEENEHLHVNLEGKQNLEKNLFDLKANYNKLKEANIILQKDYNSKISEINDLYKNIENKSTEIRDLNTKMSNLEAFECLANKEIYSLKSENSNMQLTLNSLKNEISDLKDKLKYHQQLENNLNDLIFAHDKLKLEKENLQSDLQIQLEHIKKLQQDNCNLNNESKTLLMHSEDLEKALLHARDENLMQTDSLRIYCNDIKKEIDYLQQEKISYHKKISDILDKLEESEFLRRNLDEMIISKDKKITTLENHINELEDEIRRLQYNLNEVIETGEQMKQLSYEKIDQSLKTIEAHHSKATHNMKIELAKLQNKNADLENQLSSSKLITEESYINENDNFNRINDLQKEKLEIISKIKQLELNSLGDSNLSPNTCTLNDVIVSLNRINKLINEKNTHLEKTLTNVQASYQLLKSKAEEAKKIAEEERLKIINEKGEIHKERKILEEQLENLKIENINYELIIQDLRGEIMNQTLVFNRFKQLSENDIAKLKQENVSLQDLYDNSLNAIRDLQEKLSSELVDKNTREAEIEKLNLAIEERNEENLKLQKYIETIKSTSSQHFSAQTILLPNSANVESQTDQSHLSKNLNETSTEYEPELLKLHEEEENLNFSKPFKTKNVEPTFDSVQFVYINYKLKRLSLGRLEHYSITDLREISNNDERKMVQNCFQTKSSVLNNLNASFKKSSVIDICSTREFTNSTKNSSDNDNFTSQNQSESHRSSTAVNAEYNNNIFNVNELKKNITLNGTISSSDKDMFLIYKDSQSAHDDQANTENRSWPQNGFTNMIVERAIIHTKEEPVYRRQKSTKNIIEHVEYNEKDDDSLRPKLNIDLPRVFTELSTTTLSDDDKKSLDLYSQTIYDSPKWEIYSDTKINTKLSKNTKNSSVASPILNVHHDRNSKNIQNLIFKGHSEHKINIKSLSTNQWSDVNANNNKQLMETQSPIESIYNTNSNPSLSRIDADIAILKNIEYDDIKGSNHIENNYALNYIFNSIQNDIDFNHKQNLRTNKALRNSHSERFSSFNSGLNQSEQSSSFKIYKNSPAEYISTDFNKKSNTAVTDRGILVKLDKVQDYENKIQQLSDALENMEKDYKKKIEAVKIQYENNIKHIMCEHNQGVESIQNLHEEAVREIINKHENEIENLRAMSIEAMRKAERLENENHYLKFKNSNNITFDEVPVKILPSEIKKKKTRSRPENRTLTKTIVDAFNVIPKKRSHGPCTCSLDMNISDTIRNIFKQVDVEQRQMAEIAYLKYIANKIFNDNVEILDAQELSFLHLKVCRTWKERLNKEETLRKRIDSLKNELMNKRRQTQKNMADLDRKVAEEWRLLQEVREAVCRGNSNATPDSSLEPTLKALAIVEKDVCNCNSVSCNIAIHERQSAGDLVPIQVSGMKPKRGKLETNRAVLAKLDTDERREKKLYSDETPTRLRRSHDRQHTRTNKK